MLGKFVLLPIYSRFNAYLLVDAAAAAEAEALITDNRRHFPQALPGTVVIGTTRWFLNGCGWFLLERPFAPECWPCVG